MNRTSLILLPIVFALTFSFILFTPRHHRPEESPGSAMQALEWWSNARAYPGTDIPPDGYSRAYEFYQRQLTALHKTSADNPAPWEFLGPMNAQGRCISIAVNPQNPKSLYVGTASGGLWRNYLWFDTLGYIEPHWQRIVTGFPVLGVKAIAIDPVDTGTIYIGTGEVYRYQNSRGGVAIRTTRGSFGMGLLKTTDAGVTWTKSIDWSYAQQRGVQAIRINPLNHRTIFAATTEGIYRSYDAGATWTNIYPTIMGEDILINPSDTTNILITCGNFSTPGAGIFLSIFSGDDWAPSSDGLPASFSGKAVLEQAGWDAFTVFASVADSTTGTGGFYKTTNFGLVWTPILVFSDPGQAFLYGTAGSGQGWYSHYIAVNPSDKNQILFSGVKQIRSIDGGKTFNAPVGVAHDDHHYHAHDPSNPAVLYESNDAGVVRSTDFGATFEDMGYGLVSTQFYNGFANARADSSFALGQMQDNIPGWVYRGSVNWGNTGIDEVGWSAIDPYNANVVYSVERAGSIVEKSTNKALSFPQMTPFGGTGAWNSPIVICPSNTSVLYFGKDVIYKSTDAGATWNSTTGSALIDPSGNPALSMAVSSTGTDTLYVGTAPMFGIPHVFRSTNGGTSWTDVGSSLPNRYPLDLAVDPVDSRIVFAVYGGFGSGHVFRSTNAGTDWADVSGSLPDVNTGAIIVDPHNTSHVYVGNDIGIWASTDGGLTWFPYSDGLPEAVTVSNLDICDANMTLRASTHGSGLWQRKLMSAVTGFNRGKPPLPLATTLGRNYPNPFNPSTTIPYTVSGTGRVTLTVFNITGQEVTTLVDAVMTPGSYTTRWNASAPSGIYYCRLTAGKVTTSISMLLLK